MDGSRFEAYYQLGLTALHSCNLQKAIENLERCEKLAPESFKI